MAPIKLLTIALFSGLSAFTSAQTVGLFADDNCQVPFQSVGCDDVRDSCTATAFEANSYFILQDSSDCPKDGSNNFYYGFAFFKSDPENCGIPTLVGGGGVNGCKNFGCQRMGYAPHGPATAISCKENWDSGFGD